MYIIDEDGKEYRLGDHGSEYLMKGPRVSFALVQFLPGQGFKAHLHNIIGENFYIIEGKIDIVMGGVAHHLTPGQFIHTEPHETHRYISHYGRSVKMISTLASYQGVDKAEIENYAYDRK